jgi:hypothetical protein
MPASGLKTSKRSKITPKSSIVKAPAAKQPAKLAAASSDAPLKAKAKPTKSSSKAVELHKPSSGDEFLLNSDHVTVEAVAAAAAAASSKKSKKAAASEARGVVYIGRLPHGFFEDQIKVRLLPAAPSDLRVLHVPCGLSVSLLFQAFLGQFGEVVHVKVTSPSPRSRSVHVIILINHVAGFSKQENRKIEALCIC